MMPIIDMLKNYGSLNPLPFHMPGHILGRGLINELKEAGRLDITEIPGADNLHQPKGAIRDAQRLAANCFGAEYTIFMVNGSTSGIHAMVQASFKPGDKVIVGRDCHQSVINALALIDAEPVFVRPSMDTVNHIPLGVDEKTIENSLKAFPDAKGVIVTRPNYYGIAAPLEGIQKITRKHGIPLLVDEAHGAHFIFHEIFPKPALALGADLCVQSLHKTLPSLTQTALLHGGKSSIVEPRKVEIASGMVQTTSPSYLFMASIDAARNFMEKQGRDLYQNLYECIEEFNIKIKKTKIKRIAVNYSNYYTDFSRIVLSFVDTSLSGFEAEELLRVKYGIFAEMADLNNVVLIATSFHTSRDFDILNNALSDISNKCVLKAKKAQLPQWPDIVPECAVSIREALFGETVEIPIYKSKGEVSARSVVPYPPGIPLINAGELITQDTIDYLRMILQLGGTVNGINENMIQVVKPKNNWS